MCVGSDARCLDVVAILLRRNHIVLFAFSVLKKYQYADIFDNTSGNFLQEKQFVNTSSTRGVAIFFSL